MSTSPEIVTDTARCREISLKLMRESVISMDSEGVQLGRDGPLTLLQIGTMEGHVYLFDVMENSKLFTEGRLADLLQSNDIVKVIHSCSGDSTALYHQFNVRLRNVFDTQAAHLIIEESKGRRLPSLAKLESVCLMYSTKSTVAENKDELSGLYSKEVGDLWARRPLTEDMVKYAAGDVTALIPEVYNTQKSIIESNSCWTEFNKRVEESIMYDIDDKMKVQRMERLNGIVKKVIGQFDTKYRSDTRFTDIVDEDDLKALERLDHRDAAKMSPLIDRLKTESIKARLQEIDDKLQKEGDKFQMNWRPHKFFPKILKHPDKEIQREAKRIRDRINSITLNDISRMYSTTTPLNMISEAHKSSIRSMYVKGMNDPTFDDTQLHLYWNLMADDVNNQYERFKKQTKKFKMNEKVYKRLKYFCKGDVPPFLKTKAQSFLDDLNRRFGKGNVPFTH